MFSFQSTKIILAKLDAAITVYLNVKWWQYVMFYDGVPLAKQSRLPCTQTTKFTRSDLPLCRLPSRVGFLLSINRVLQYWPTHSELHSCRLVSNLSTWVPKNDRLAPYGRELNGGRAAFRLAHISLASIQVTEEAVLTATKVKYAAPVTLYTEKLNNMKQNGGSVVYMFKTCGQNWFVYNTIHPLPHSPFPFPIPIPSFPFPIPPFPNPHSLFPHSPFPNPPFPNSPLPRPPIPHSPFPIPHSPFPIPHSPLP